MRAVFYCIARFLCSELLADRVPFIVGNVYARCYWCAILVGSQTKRLSVPTINETLIADGDVSTYRPTGLISMHSLNMILHTDAKEILIYGSVTWQGSIPDPKWFTVSPIFDAD